MSESEPNPKKNGNGKQYKIPRGLRDRVSTVKCKSVFNPSDPSQKETRDIIECNINLADNTKDNWEKHRKKLKSATTDPIITFQIDVKTDHELIIDVKNLCDSNHVKCENVFPSVYMKEFLELLPKTMVVQSTGTVISSVKPKEPKKKEEPKMGSPPPPPSLRPPPPPPPTGTLGLPPPPITSKPSSISITEARKGVQEELKVRFSNEFKKETECGDLFTQYLEKKQRVNQMEGTESEQFELGQLSELEETIDASCKITFCDRITKEIEKQGKKVQTTTDQCEKKGQSVGKKAKESCVKAELEPAQNRFEFLTDEKGNQCNQSEG